MHYLDLRQLNMYITVTQAVYKQLSASGNLIYSIHFSSIRTDQEVVHEIEVTCTSVDDETSRERPWLLERMPEVLSSLHAARISNPSNTD